MFIAFGAFLILSKIEVLFSQQEDKLTSAVLFEQSLESFHVSPFLLGNDSIRLNITWNNDLVSLEEIAIDGFNYDCSFSSIDNVSGYDSLVVPSLDMIYPYENIMPGCVYTLTIKLENASVTEDFTENYTVPDCVEKYCACITNRTNLINLVNVEMTGMQLFKISYISQNTNMDKGNYNITEIFYINEITDDRFNIYEFNYVKDAIEIHREHLQSRLQFGENYTLFMRYKDLHNINPDCEYTSLLNFIAPYPAPEDEDFLIIQTAIIFVFLFFVLALVCILVKCTVFSTKNLKNIKRFLFPVYEESPKIQTLKKTSFCFPNQQINTLYTPLELSDDPYEFPRENIIIKDVLGEGEFGKVYYAKAYNLNGLPGFTMVAVKLLREGAPKEEMMDFQAEIKMLKNIGVHKNIVKFLGCVTKFQPYMTIMELVANGDLKEYLIKLRGIWMQNNDQRLFFPDDMEEKTANTEEPKQDSEGTLRFDVDMQTPLLPDIGTRPEPVLDHRELENFAHQIATGMAYLEKIPVTHRDLAARNILITKDKILKISDFGMSRSGPYVNRNLKKVPLRWMAIEAIELFKTDSRSDVWSFGVVLWEIGTLGAFPYEHIPNDLLWKALKSGIRLPRPEICTDELYTLMQRCWKEDPKDRPAFADIVEQFAAKKQHVYVDFKHVNPKYVFPPTDPV